MPQTVPGTSLQHFHSIQTVEPNAQFTLEIAHRVSLTIVTAEGRIPGGFASVPPKSLHQLVQESVQCGIEPLGRLVAAISDLAANLGDTINPDFTATSDLGWRIKSIDTRHVAGEVELIHGCRRGPGGGVGRLMWLGPLRRRVWLRRRNPVWAVNLHR